MQVVRRVDELRESLAHGQGSCVLVPTMGALHAGHLALVKRAREVAGADARVVVSIFVNPIQFDRKGDLETYPRTEEDDLKACEDEGVDLVFIPDEGEMYSADRSVTVTDGDAQRADQLPQTMRFRFRKQLFGKINGT